MKALITGASGFVGRFLAAHLRENGDEVIATSRSSGGPDITNAASTAHFIASAAPEVVYHLAGQSDVQRSWLNPTESYRANVEGTSNVLDAARLAGCRRVIAILSADVYGRVASYDLPIAETQPLRPVSPYAASKAAAEHVCQQAVLGYGFDVVRVRPFTHIGPGQTPRFVVAALAWRIAQAERSGDGQITVGRLDTRRDFTDVRDIVRAYRLLALHGVAGEVYNVCSGTDIAIDEIAGRLLAMSERPLQLVSDPELQRPADIPVLRGDASKLTSATGWAPSIPLADTLHAVLDDARDRSRPSPTHGAPSHFD